MTSINYVLYACMDGKVSMIFNRNCFPKLKDFARLGDLQACSHVHRKSGSMKEMVQDRHVVTTHH